MIGGSASGAGTLGIRQGAILNVRKAVQRVMLMIVTQGDALMAQKCEQQEAT